MQSKGKLKFKLFYRVMLLISIPLCFQILLVGGLSLMLHDAETERVHELHAKKVLARVNALMYSVIESTKVIGMALMVGGHDLQEKYHRVVDPIPGELEELRKLMKDNPVQLRKVDDLQMQADKSLAVLSRGIKMVDEGNRLGAIMELKNMKPLYDALSEKLDGLKKEANDIANESPERQERNRQNMKVLLLVAVGINIFLALFFAWSFNRGATRRLSVLVDNTRRLAAGAELNPSVGGGDEIARLDDDFRSMAEQLRVAQDTQRVILKTMPLAVAHTTMDGTIVHANHVLSGMLDCTDRELTGSKLGDFFLTAQLPVQRDILNECLNGEGKHGENEFEVLAKDGRLLTVGLTLAPIKTTEGDRLLAVLQDHTQRKEVERMQQDFVAMINHDLRTPLTAIRLFIDMFSKGAIGAVSSSGVERAELCQLHAERLINMINDFLDLEKLESGTFELSRKPVNLAALVDSVIELGRTAAAQKGVKLRFLWNEDAFVQGDAVRLERVVNVLLENAIKSSERGAIVRVEMGRQGSSILLSVSDQGQCVPVSLRPTIFERYKPELVDRQAEEKGSGLALALCKALVVAHGGEIGLDCLDGKGNTFWIRLPAVDA